MHDNTAIFGSRAHGYVDADAPNVFSTLPKRAAVRLWASHVEVPGSVSARSIVQ
jgi:hypothetical protein